MSEGSFASSESHHHTENISPIKTRAECIRIRGAGGGRGSRPSLGLLQQTPQDRSSAGATVIKVGSVSSLRSLKIIDGILSTIERRSNRSSLAVKKAEFQPPQKERQSKLVLSVGNIPDRGTPSPFHCTILKVHPNSSPAVSRSCSSEDDNDSNNDYSVTCTVGNPNRSKIVSNILLRTLSGAESGSHHRQDSQLTQPQNSHFQHQISTDPGANETLDFSAIPGNSEDDPLNLIRVDGGCGEASGGGSPSITLTSIRMLPEFDGGGLDELPEARPTLIPRSNDFTSQTTECIQDRQMDSEEDEDAEEPSQEPDPTDDGRTAGGRTRWSEDSSSVCVKGCCGCRALSQVSPAAVIRWFVVTISVLGLICVLVGIVLGALTVSGSTRLTLCLLLIGVGIVLITVSGIAWRLTTHLHPASNSSSCLALLGLRSSATSPSSIRPAGIRSPMPRPRYRSRGPNSAWFSRPNQRHERFSGPNGRIIPPRFLPPRNNGPMGPRVAASVAYLRPPGAMGMPPEFHWHPPPPSYQATMEEQRINRLLQAVATGTVPTDSHATRELGSPPPTYRTNTPASLRPGLEVLLEPALLEEGSMDMNNHNNRSDAPVHSPQLSDISVSGLANDAASEGGHSSAIASSEDPVVVPEDLQLLSEQPPGFVGNGINNPVYQSRANNYIPAYGHPDPQRRTPTTSSVDLGIVDCSSADPVSFNIPSSNQSNAESRGVYNDNTAQTIARPRPSGTSSSASTVDFHAYDEAMIYNDSPITQCVDSETHPKSTLHQQPNEDDTPTSAHSGRSRRSDLPPAYPYPPMPPTHPTRCPPFPNPPPVGLNHGIRPVRPPPPRQQMFNNGPRHMMAPNGARLPSGMRLQPPNLHHSSSPPHHHLMMHPPPGGIIRHRMQTRGPPPPPGSVPGQMNLGGPHPNQGLYENHPNRQGAYHRSRERPHLQGAAGPNVSSYV